MVSAGFCALKLTQHLILMHDRSPVSALLVPKVDCACMLLRQAPTFKMNVVQGLHFVGYWVLFRAGAGDGWTAPLRKALTKEI